MTKPMRKLFLLGIICFFVSFAVANGLGQDMAAISASQQTVQNDTTVESFRADQQALLQERRAMVAKGATPEQLRAWRQQNASKFQALQEKATKIGQSNDLQPRRMVPQVPIPANATPAMAAFLSSRATLANDRAQIHNQMLQTLRPNPTKEQVEQMRQQEREAFQQQFGPELTKQTKRAQKMAQASEATVHQEPPPLKIPACASPKLAAFLTTRDQIQRSRIQVLNRDASADEPTRQASLRQWQEQNAALLQQIQQQAAAISTSN